MPSRGLLSTDPRQSFVFQGCLSRGPRTLEAPCKNGCGHCAGTRQESTQVAKEPFFWSQRDMKPDWIREVINAFPGHEVGGGWGRVPTVHPLTLGMISI